MPKSLYLLTLCLCFGCVTVQSTQKQLNSGNYDEAITNTLKELRPNKTKSQAQPYVFLLQEAFIKAQERDQRSLASPAADNFVKRYPKPLLTAALLPDLLAPVIHELEQDNMS